MIILHVSNLRFNRRWFQWLLDRAPRHDLLVVAGNLVDHALPTSISSQRAWVRAWLADYGQPACIASGPEDQEFNPQTNAWLPAAWLKEIAPPVCTDGEFVEHDGFSVHCIRYGEMPVDRHAEIWVAHRDPRLAFGGMGRFRHGGCDDSVTISDATAVPIILTGDTMDRLRWHSLEKGTLHLNAGWMPSAPFPSHVLLDPASFAARRVSATNSIPRVDVFEPGFRHANGTSSRVESQPPRNRCMSHSDAHRKPGTAPCL
jgi:hypothetical protein